MAKTPVNKRISGGTRSERSDPDLVARVLEAKAKLATGEGFTVFKYDCHRCAREAFKALPAEEQSKVFTSLEFARMFLCPTCGNKRCPKATDHRLDCTNSNEPGQKGSRYE